MRLPRLNRPPLTSTLLALVAAAMASACTPAAAPAATAGDGAAESAPELTFGRGGDASTGPVTLEDGGTISATAADGTTFELVVPPMAVADDTEIRMTPLTDVHGITEEPGVVHAVQLEPEGLVFHELARLTIVPAEPIPLDRQLMFTAADDGSNAGSALVDPASEPIVIVLEHFTVGGVASVTPQQRRTFREKSAASAEERLGREVGANLQDQRERELTDGDDEGGTTPRDELDRIADEYQREVIDKRRANADESCQALRTYVETVIRWEQKRQLAGMTSAEEAASLGRVAEAVAYAEARYETCEREAIAKCRDAQDPAILVDFWLSMDRPADRERAERTCRGQDYRIDKTVNVTQMNVTVAIQYTGTKCDGHEGEWTIDSNGTLSGYGGTAAIGGPIVVDIPASSTEGTLQGTANFDDENQGHTEGHFVGTARFVEEPSTLELTVTGGSGSGYSYGFLDTGVTGPGTLTFPLERGDFCD
jgi:hypothetical protein